MNGWQGVPCPQLTLCFPTGHGYGHDDGVLPLHLYHSGNVPPGPVRKGGASVGEGYLRWAWASLLGSARAGADPSRLKVVAVAPGEMTMISL